MPIFGMAFTQGHKIHNSVLVNRMFRNLMLFSARGKAQTSGVAITTDANITVVKEACSAQDFQSNANFKYALDSNMLLDTTSRLISLIGHCHTKKPEKYVSADIHPIVCNNIVGVHSGNVANADTLFSAYNLIRKGTYSGEIAFSLMNYLYCNYKIEYDQPLRQAMALVMRIISGNSNIAFVSKTNPYTLWLGTERNPLYVRDYYKEGLIVFAEETEAIDDTVNNWSLGSYKERIMAENSVLAYDLYTNTYLCKSISEAKTEAR